MDRLLAEMPGAPAALVLVVATRGKVEIRVTAITGRDARDPEATKGWRDLSPRQKGGIVAAVVVQIGLLLAALSDIHRRPEGQVQGNKKWPWTLAAFVNFVGPVSSSESARGTIRIGPAAPCGCRGVGFK